MKSASDFLPESASTGRHLKQPHLGCDWKAFRNLLPPSPSEIPPRDTFSLKVLIFVKIQIPPGAVT